MGLTMTTTAFDPDAVYHQLKAVEKRTRERHFGSSLIRWWDGDMNINIELRNEVFTEGEDPVYAVGGGKTQVPYKSPEGYFAYDWLPDPEDLHMTVEIHDPDDPWRGYESRVTYKALDVDLVEDEDGTEFVEVTWVTLLAHWEHMILMANPILPVIFQLPHIFAIALNTRTAYLTAWQLNLAVTYAPLYRFPDNPFSLKAYREAVDPRTWPMVVNPRTLLGDRSKPTITNFRFDMALDAMKQGLKDAQCIPWARQWLVGDPQPFPEFMTLVRNTIIIDIEQREGVPGLTGTMVDGWIQLIVELADDLVTEVVHPILDPNDMTPLPSQTPIGDALGLAPAQPWPVFRRGQYSGLVGSRISKKKSTGSVFWTGGRSPEWVNQGIALAISTALEYVGFAMAIPGLGNLYQGQLDNTVLAFAKVEDRPRARKAGRFGLRHVWCSEGATGFGISTGLALRQGWYLSRPHLVRQAEVLDGFPYLIGRHIRRGSWCVFEMPDESLYIDQITNVKHRRDRESELRYVLVCGDDEDDEDPIAQLFRHYNDLRTVGRKLFLER
ncbi:minor tail protein [Gordonia phage Nyceirae]|uniref:Minor tail protein n=1 Tax=Gordonia phage Nyceirae TaxID=1887651 RepID=A0A1C9EHX5_9CAUD|nr:minor tail protein [Gordonia phage Nyceirae]AON97386.1 minor tail protein [Gordonia phage Nyceirae]